ncbi:hypothetical protein HSR122_0295 [Halapricum desulfuricans]|uniref:Uncharacterized protein n=1 Tax=Halapricum desulfuricans TaxID=2841257 RepID=A0A897N605_9EURY|nr:hypothetical protein HSR122_0295 [Halapricum desulfuricans]
MHARSSGDISTGQYVFPRSIRTRLDRFDHRFSKARRRVLAGVDTSRHTRIHSRIETLRCSGRGIGLLDLILLTV